MELKVVNPFSMQRSKKKLAECINTMCKIGFSPTTHEILDIVAAYLKANQIEAPMFKEGKPSREWPTSFIRRNKLSLKKVSMISSARKSATSNPFIIYDFDEKLEDIIKSKGLTIEQIRNCDESGFPTDSAKCKVISTKGKPAYEVTCVAQQENITTLAVCNAAGKALDPLIFFNGKNLQSSWRGDRALPKTWYGVSENGWMTTKLFESWFSKFAMEITMRPLLGNEMAMRENITILKLPPHVTDLLQPLDVSVFGPLKRLWEAKLNSYINEFGPREPVRKATFVNLLSEIWHKGMTMENIKSGFFGTGIYPVDKTKFPTSCLDSTIISRRLGIWNFHTNKSSPPFSSKRKLDSKRRCNCRWKVYKKVAKGWES